MLRRSLLLLSSLLLVPGLGCAKRASDAESAAPSMDYGGDGMAAAGSAGPSEPSPMPSREAYDFDDSKLAEARDVPTSVQAAPATTPRPSGGKPEIATDNKPIMPEVSKGDEVSDTERKKQFARQIIYTAELQLSVYKLDDAMQRAEALTLAAGGYVQNMSQGYYVLRIPAPALRGIMDELAHLGVVEARTLQARDVSEEFVDLTTRIRVLRETQQQLLALLRSARTVEEALKVRASLDGVTMELEQAMGRLRLLESLIGFSTLTVRMSLRGPQNAVPSSNDPFPWVDGLGVEATEWN
ncbi:MAG: DUF4349 domain-containing protein [Nannocystis sp.]|nr:DUF4349 domain-containing protein [Nannocystis sp.]MBA3548882.1 DUF4349 domain-containing protein [Nannocystis sp.]